MNWKRESDLSNEYSLKNILFFYLMQFSTFGGAISIVFLSCFIISDEIKYLYLHNISDDVLNIDFIYGRVFPLRTN